MKKTAWIIGANSDVAKEFISLINGKYRIIAASRNTAKLEEFAKKRRIEELTIEHIDLSETYSVDDFLEKCNEPPNLILFSQGLLETDPDVLPYLNEMVKVNYVSAVYIIERVWQKMSERGSGVIIGITSVAADRGKKYNKIYGSTKAGFSNYLEALMQQGRNSNIQVINVKPGYIRTKLIENNPTIWKSRLSVSPFFVAKKIVSVINSGKSRTIYVRGIWKLIMGCWKCIPEKIYCRM